MAGWQNPFVHQIPGDTCCMWPGVPLETRPTKLAPDQMQLGVIHCPLMLLIFKSCLPQSEIRRHCIAIASQRRDMHWPSILNECRATGSHVTADSTKMDTSCQAEITALQQLLLIPAMHRPLDPVAERAQLANRQTWGCAPVHAGPRNARKWLGWGC